MNATHCKRCETELVASPGATNQAYCGTVCREEALEASPLRTSPSHELFERQHQECVALNRRGTAALEE